MSLLYRPSKKENREGGSALRLVLVLDVGQIAGRNFPCGSLGGVLGGLSLGGSWGLGPGLAPWRWAPWPLGNEAAQEGKGGYLA